MSEYVCLIGLDEPESAEIQARLDVPVVAHVVLPGMMVRDGQLWVEGSRGPRLVPVSKVVFHGIYEDDFDYIAGLALWNGPCMPNARAMLDSRMKFACLVRALEHTRFGMPGRGFATRWVQYDTEIERVAKWGNWHCGENKERFTSVWRASEPSVIEHFLEGQAVRVVVIGDQAWQIRLAGDDWLKSIHHAQADFMDLDADLLDDTQTIQAAFGLELIANDYIVGPDGSKHLLEVNHIPNVTRFSEIWAAYRDYVVNWINND